jgi:hypothetical protein
MISQLRRRRQHRSPHRSSWCHWQRLVGHDSRHGVFTRCGRKFGSQEAWRPCRERPAVAVSDGSSPHRRTVAFRGARRTRVCDFSRICKQLENGVEARSVPSVLSAAVCCASGYVGQPASIVDDLQIGAEEPGATPNCPGTRYRFNW